MTRESAAHYQVRSEPRFRLDVLRYLRALPVPSQKELLATLVEALLLEIAAALAGGEISDDQDHS